MNFTVTRSSLQSQCLNEVLKAERPDVDEKRSDLLKLQGRFWKVLVLHFQVVVQVAGWALRDEGARMTLDTPENRNAYPVFAFKGNFSCVYGS